MMLMKKATQLLITSQMNKALSFLLSRLLDGRRNVYLLKEMNLSRVQVGDPIRHKTVISEQS